MRSNKSQITIFIIMGIVILFSTSLYFYIRYQQAGIEYVPTELLPVKSYVEQCMQNIGRDAVERAGLQGGYVNVPQQIKNNPRAFLPLIPGSNVFIIPLWYYDDETRIPSIADMEAQMDFYILKNLESCLNGFEPFLNTYSISAVKHFTPKTTIADKTVIINLDYPLELTEKANAKQTSISKFRTELPVRFGRLYNLAKELMLEENKGTWIENFTVDTMVLGGIPFSGMQASPCRPLTWLLSNVRNDIKDLIFYNLPRVRIANTDYDPFPPDEEYAATHMLWEPKIKNYNDLKVGLQYDRSWFTTINARPRSGNIMQSGAQKGVAKYMAYLCINIYHFTYDVEYPIMVSIADSTAFNRQGFTFRFAFPVIINHNQAQRVFTEPLPEPVAQYRGSFCDDRLQESADIRAVDFYTLNELAGVNLTYRCMMFECPIGTTRMDNIATRLLTGLPAACANGEVVAQFPGYLDARKTVLQGEHSATLEMIPLKTFELRILKYDISNLYSSKYIDRGDLIFVDAKDLSYPKHAINAIYPAIEGETPTLELIDGDNTYQLELSLINGNNFIGGYNANWTVRYDEIKDKTRVTLKVIEFPEARNAEQNEEALAGMFDYLDNSTLYADLLRPEFE